MERNRPNERWQRRPDLESYPPRDIFLAAQHLEEYHQQRNLSSRSYLMALGEAAFQLNRHFETQFSGAPRVELETASMYWSSEKVDETTGQRLFTPKKHTYSAEEELYGAIRLEGPLLGFHAAPAIEGVSEKPALYAHVGGTPLERHMGHISGLAHSVPVAEVSEFQLVSERDQALLDHLFALVNEVPKDEYPIVYQAMTGIIAILGDSTLGFGEQLQRVNGHAMNALRTSPRGGRDERIVYTLCELISLKMKLNRRMSISTRSYREIVTTPRLGWHVPRGEGIFSGVQPRLAPIGESQSSQLGLYFHYEADNVNQAIGIPVADVVQITPWHQ